MGEIEDGAFAILETGRLMSQTLPQYKFYADIAKLPFVKTKKPTDEVIRELDLVQMPTTIREGTIQPVYGKLSGTYVPREVKENLVNMYKASQGTSNKGLKAYKFLISPLLGNSCRYFPTCSDYSIESLKTFGFFKGIYKSLKRIFSCHPIRFLGGCEGFDPVNKDMKVKK